MTSAIELQRAYAQALIVDREALAQHQHRQRRADGRADAEARLHHGRVADPRAGARAEAARPSIRSPRIGQSGYRAECGKNAAGQTKPRWWHSLRVTMAVTQFASKICARQARRRVPRAIFDYADRGSYDEVTFNRNLGGPAGHPVAPTRDGRRVAAAARHHHPRRAIGPFRWGSGPPVSRGCFTPMARCWARAPRRPSACRSASAPCPSARSKTCAAWCRSRSGSRSI